MLTNERDNLNFFIFFSVSTFNSIQSKRIIIVKQEEK